MHGPVFSSEIDEESFTMDHFDIIIGAILLLVIFVVVKIVIQAILVGIAKKKKEQQQLHMDVLEKETTNSGLKP